MKFEPAERHAALVAVDLAMLVRVEADLCMQDTRALLNSLQVAWINEL